MGDIYGRKPIFMLGLWMNLILVIGMIFVTNLYLCYVICFMMGVSMTARYYIGLTYNLEMSTDSAQVYVMTIYFVAESLISLFVCQYFLLISKEWVYLAYPNIGLTFFGIVCLAFMPESPRFLVANKQFDKARMVLQIIANFNKSPFNCETLIFEGEKEHHRLVRENEGEDPNPEKPSWKDICRDPPYLKNLLASIVLYAETTFCFYMLMFYLKYFPGSIYKNASVFAVSDLVAFVMAGIILKVATMRKGMILSSFVAGCGGLSYLLFSDRIEWIPFMVCTSRIGMTMLFNICLISVNRLFRTINVATAYGLVNFFAHLFACLGPEVAEIQNPYPFLVFEILVGIGFFCIFFLTESSQIEADKKALRDNKFEINEKVLECAKGSFDEYQPESHRLAEDSN